MRQIVNEQAYDLRITFAGAFASVTLSAAHLWFDPLLNPDGVLYLLTAQGWLDEGYGAASAMYPLPFYSILIALVHMLTGLSLLTSARCLDAALIAILLVAVQRLTWAFGGAGRAQFIAVVLGLMLPELNGLRSFIIRDFGYWALSVIALIVLVRYAQAPNVRRSVLFFLLCVGAAAFRLEAIPFMLLMPIALFFGAARRPIAAVALYLPPASALAIVGLVTLTSPDTATSGHWLTGAVQMSGALVSEFPARIQSELDGFGQHVLDPRFHDYAGFGLAGGLATMVLVHVANAASLPVLAIAGIGLARRTLGTLDRRIAPLLWMAFAIVLLGLATVLTARGIIQTRYAMPAGFLIVVIAAFVVDAWFARASTAAARLKLRSCSVLVLVYFLGEGGFALQNSNQYYLDTAEWLKRYTEPNVHIFSSDLRVVYLADRPIEWRDLSLVRPGSPAPASADYDYWIIHVTRDDPASVRLADAEPRWQRVAEFFNRKGAGFVIYRASPTRS